MEIVEFTVEDSHTVEAVVDLVNAAGKVDSPFAHPQTVLGFSGTMRYGWDGEAPTMFAARESGSLVGLVEVHTSGWDNTHLAWVEFVVHPDLRRRGHGSRLLEFAKETTRSLGRTSMGCDGWDNDTTNGFATPRGLPRKSSAINRRQFLASVDRQELETMYDEAPTAASPYELIRITGHTPDDMLKAVAKMTEAINDAPTDDLDVEDEVFPKERILAYENAQEARGNRLYRIVARHRDSGELAGHSVVAVEAERPAIGEQHDTSVLRAHRGHRLGLVLKADMVRWLAECEPGLETIDTWNAESNDHMIEVNEKLGYQVLARGLQFQINV